MCRDDSAGSLSNFCHRATPTQLSGFDNGAAQTRKSTAHLFVLLMPRSSEIAWAAGQDRALPQRATLGVMPTQRGARERMKLPQFIVRYLDRVAASRVPDEIIGDGERSRAPHGTPVKAPFMHRWIIIPKNKWLNIYYHCFIRDDEDRALHDHPWMNASYVTHGCYREILPGQNRRLVREGQWVFRRATDAHRIELPVWQYVGGERHGKVPSWSLFITGPVTRLWGFLCKDGWRSHFEFHGRDGCS
jgi:hypothetical protein